MSVAKNNIVRQIAPKTIFGSALGVLSTSVTYNQGDLIAFDATNKILKPVTGAGDAANILGVAIQTIVNGVAKSPYQGTMVDASVGLSDIPGPQYGVVAYFNTVSGDSFTPGCSVFLSSNDPQVVTVTGSTSIGVYQGKTFTSAASGNTVDVLVGARYGMSGLAF